MAIEKKWEEISPLSLTSDGGTEGQIFVSSTLLFKVKQDIILKADTLPPLFLEVKRVVSTTEILVGQKGHIKNLANVSAYTTALNATIEAPEQNRTEIPEKEHERAVYAEEPIVAKRVILTDRYGDYFATDNPIPVQLSDGSINIGTLNADLEVQLSHLDDDPDAGDVHDSIRIGDGTEELAINPDGSINVVTSSGSAGILKSEYNEINALAASMVSSLVTITAAIGKTTYLQKIPVSGTNVAEYTVKLNGDIIDKKRTYFGAHLDTMFDFSDDAGKGLPLEEGDVILVEVEHIRPFSGDFNGRIQYIEF